MYSTQMEVCISEIEKTIQQFKYTSASGRDVVSVRHLEMAISNIKTSCDEVLKEEAEKSPGWWAYPLDESMFKEILHYALKQIEQELIDTRISDKGEKSEADSLETMYSYWKQMMAASPVERDTIQNAF